ncbi:hypothetical protein Bpfe_027427, partial [Biomphalaria pfeifferi]
MAGYPSIWSIIKANIEHTVEVAFNQTMAHFTSYSLDLHSFKSNILELLQLPLSNIPAGHLMGQGNQTVNSEINATVYQAVYGALSAMNASTVSNGSASTFDHAFSQRLSFDIEMEVFNEIFHNSTEGQNHNGGFTDFFHSLPLKDETLFVALVCMAIIVPVIFITLFFIFFYKRRQENKERSHEMLLREQPENAVEEFK